MLDTFGRNRRSIAFPDGCWSFRSNASFLSAYRDAGTGRLWMSVVLPQLGTTASSRVGPITAQPPLSIRVSSYLEVRSTEHGAGQPRCQNTASPVRLTPQLLQTPEVGAGAGTLTVAWIASGSLGVGGRLRGQRRVCRTRRRAREGLENALPQLDRGSGLKEMPWVKVFWSSDPIMVR